MGRNIQLYIVQIYRSHWLGTSSLFTHYHPLKQPQIYCKLAFQWYVSLQYYHTLF